MVLDMALSKLGNYIEQIDVRNKDNQFGPKDVMGISVSKTLISTKADLSNINLDGYKILRKGQFAYCLVTSRNGNRISIVYNDEKDCVISAINPVFQVNNIEKLCPEYLMIFFNRPEFDRFARFNSWGSARETFSWEDMCDIEIDLPPIEIQRKYVAIYKGLKDNLKVYQSKLDDLKLVYEGYIEKLRKEMGTEEIGPYIQEVNVKNIDNIKNVLGVDSTSNFVNTKAKMNGIDLTKYSVVKEGQFAYNPSRINLGSIALRKGQECVISPMYEIFEIKDNTKLVSEYLFMWLTRKEFLRSTLCYAIGSVRDTFDFNLMKQVKISIPSKEIQEDVVKIHNSYIKRKQILDKLKQTINGICPILIRGAIKEANDGVD